MSYCGSTLIHNDSLNHTVDILSCMAIQDTPNLIQRKSP